MVHTQQVNVCGGLFQRAVVFLPARVLTRLNRNPYARVIREISQTASMGSIVVVKTYMTNGVIALCLLHRQSDGFNSLVRPRPCLDVERQGHQSSSFDRKSCGRKPSGRCV